MLIEFRYLFRMIGESMFSSHTFISAFPGSPFVLFSLSIVQVVLMFLFGCYLHPCISFFAFGSCLVLFSTGYFLFLYSIQIVIHYFFISQIERKNCILWCFSATLGALEKLLGILYLRHHNSPS